MLQKQGSSIDDKSNSCEKSNYEVKKHKHDSVKFMIRNFINYRVLHLENVIYFAIQTEFA